MIPSVTPIFVFAANLRNGNDHCAIRVQRYWANDKRTKEAVQFDATDSTFQKHYGHPEDFKTKMRLNDSCQVTIPRERSNDVLVWIQEYLHQAFGPNCQIEITFPKKDK